MTETPESRFEAQRTPLFRHAYRMLGARAEAQDVVQDAYLRFSAAVAAHVVEDERAFLRTTVTRLCIDRLRSASARREVYVGPWLPEPLVEADRNDPEAIVALADEVSFALLLALERLSALERAAFLLHDVMDVPFAEIAVTLGRSEGAVKRLASRARVHVREPRKRRNADATVALRLRERFTAAIIQNDLAAMSALLTQDVVMISDSNGKVPAAMFPVRGADRVARFFLGIARKAPPGTRVELARINGGPGFAIFDVTGLVQTVAFEIVDDRISGCYITRNPEKLGR